MSHPKWQTLIANCLKSTEFMALSTNGEKGLWVNPVYFSWDESYNFYFISQLDCTHMDNISSNSEVACAIFPTDKPLGNDVFGAYLKGHAHILDKAEDIKIADEIYYGRVYSDNNKISKKSDNYRNDPSWHFVKISLNGLWYFDTRYFDENRVEVPREIWG